MKRILLLICAGLLLFSSCKKHKDEDDVIILTKIVNTQDYYNTGDVVTFEINSFANQGSIHKINVASFSVGMDVLLDTVINAEKAKFHFFYNVPSFNDTLQKVKFEFKAICSTGSESIMTENILVKSYDAPLEELGQFTMYSAVSGNKDGFSLTLLQTVYSQIDTLYCDFRDNTVDPGGTLCREWIGNNDLLFARFNDFNYTGATRRSVMNTYNDSNKSNIISDINNDDIIFVGNEQRAYGVMKVVAVYDDEGVANDRYCFYLKKINY